jgi:hypothetical protein
MYKIKKEQLPKYYHTDVCVEVDFTRLRARHPATAIKNILFLASTNRKNYQNVVVTNIRKGRLVLDRQSTRR